MVTPLTSCCESLTGYRLFNHGEAVAISMVAAGQLAVELVWEQASQERQLALIQKNWASHPGDCWVTSKRF